MNSLLQMSGWYVHDRYIKVPHNILEKTTHMKLTFYNIPNEKKNGVKSIAQFLLCGIFEPNNNALLNHVIYINERLMHGYTMTNIIRGDKDKDKDSFKSPISTDMYAMSRITGLSDRFKIHLYTFNTTDERYNNIIPVSYTHLRAHETPEHLVCRLLLEKKKKKNNKK